MTSVCLRTCRCVTIVCNPLSSRKLWKSLSAVVITKNRMAAMAMTRSLIHLVRASGVIGNKKIYLVNVTDATIKKMFSGKINFKLYGKIALQKLKIQWVRIFCNVIGFFIIAWVINYWIDILAYQTCLYVTLKSKGILEENSSEWTIILFFKNILIIPFTLIFETLFLLWITNKFSPRFLTLRE